MKKALSALLDELISAERVIYDDCARWQIQCPACHEAVFKVARDEGSRTLHYFSHYRRDKLLAEECELRVGAMSAEEVAKHNAKARGQTLAYYLSVLREEIVQQLCPEFSLKVLPMIGRGKTLHEIIRSIVERAGSGSRDKWGRHFLSIVQDFEKDHIRRLKPETAFSQARTQEITNHIWRHLISRTGRENLEFLLMFSAYSAWDHFRSAGDLSADSMQIRDALADILFGSQKEARAAVGHMQHQWIRLSNIDPPSRGDAAITHTIVIYAASNLLTLDYFKMLRDFRASNVGSAK